MFFCSNDPPAPNLQFQGFSHPNSSSFAQCSTPGRIIVVARMARVAHRNEDIRGRGRCEEEGEAIPWWVQVGLLIMVVSLFARRRVRHPHGPGTSGAYRRANHDGLHARFEPGRPRGKKPRRHLVSERAVDKPHFIKYNKSRPTRRGVIPSLESAVLNVGLTHGPLEAVDK